MNFSRICMFVIVILVTYVASKPIIHPKKAVESIQHSDQQFILNCALANRALENRSCYLVNNLPIDASNLRGVTAMHYYYMLVDAFLQIDQCLYFEARMVPLPNECSFLNDVNLIEHCFLHHQLREYKPCANISYPRMALPKDAQTLFRYLTWTNVTAEYNAKHAPKNLRDAKSIVRHCLHSNSWRSAPNDICNQIATPNPRVSYSSKMTRMQMVFQQMQFADRKRDCQYYHKKDVENGVGECGAYAPYFKHAVNDMVFHRHPKHWQRYPLPWLIE